MKEERLLWLDGVRGIAIIMVMLTHISQVSVNNLSFEKIFLFGQYGVQVFFVISAITCVITLKNKEMIKEWYIKRIVRISLIYYFGLILYYFAFLFMKSKGIDRYTGYNDLENVLFNIFYLHAWIPSANNSVVPGGWSIGVEVFFYFICPFFILIDWKNIKYTFPILIFSLFIINYTFFSFEDNSYYYYWPLNQIPLLLTVVYLFRLLNEKNINFLKIEKNRFVFSFIGILFLIISLLVGVYFNFDYISAPFLFGLGIFSFLMSIKNKNIFENYVLIFFGRISFSLYIIHFFCIDLARFLIKFFSLSSYLNNFLVLIIVFLFVFSSSLILAFLCHNHIESKYYIVSSFFLDKLKSKKEVGNA